MTTVVARRGTHLSGAVLLLASAISILAQTNPTSVNSQSAAYPQPQGVGVLEASILEEPKGVFSLHRINPQSVPEPDLDVESYCSTLGGTTKSPTALTQVCHFVLTLSKELPDIICQRRTRRFWRAYGVAHRDVVVSKVAYFDHIEHDIDVVKTDASGPGDQSQTNSSLSGGEFSSDLQDVFAPSSDATFKFVGTASLRSTAALVFQFHVERENNHLYQVRVHYLNAPEVKDFPGYQGKIWVDKSTFQLLRMVRRTTHMARNFPITRVDEIIDYANTPLGDGSSFVVPTRVDMISCSRDEGRECSHNIVSFVDYHKFRATTKILPGAVKP